MKERHKGEGMTIPKGFIVDVRESIASGKGRGRGRDIWDSPERTWPN